MSLIELTLAHSLQWCAYNNIRASLVLLLVSTMGFSDLNAFTFYSTVIALGDIMSLPGGWYGDKISGHHSTWLFGYIILAITLLFSGLLFKTSTINLIIIFSIIATSIGISRCNGTSLVYSKINQEVDPNRRNSAVSLLYTILISASLIAYSISGIISQKLGMPGLFLSSGIIAIIAIVLFISSEYQKLQQIFNQELLIKLFKLACGTIVLISLAIVVFIYNHIVNILLWITLIVSLIYVIFHSRNSSTEEKERVKLFVFYLLWLIIYCIFERQFGMVMPLFLSRHFDNHIFEITIPITNILSLFQIFIIIFSILIYKSRIQDKINNGTSLLIGFSTSLIAFGLLYFSCVINVDNIVNSLLVLISIIFFAISDLFILNRIFSICRVAPKAIHAITSGIMMISVACSFHGAKMIAGLMVVNSTLDKGQSIGIYQKGFLINSSLLLFFTLVIILSYKSKIMRRIL